MDKKSLLNNKEMFRENAANNHLIEYINFASNTWLSIRLYLLFLLQMKFKNKTQLLFRKQFWIHNEFN